MSEIAIIPSYTVCNRPCISRCRSLRFQQEIEQLKKQLELAPALGDSSHAPALGDSSHGPMDVARGEEEQQVRGRISELEAELDHLRSSTEQCSSRDSNEVSVLLREVEALKQTSEQLRQRLAAAEVEGRNLQAAAASETTALRGELEGFRNANQALRGQVLASTGGRGRGETATSELDGVAHANRQLQQELASLQRQMRDRQETLQHEVKGVSGTAGLHCNFGCQAAGW